MDRNRVKPSEGRLLSASKIIATVVGIIGIALLAFSDPMRKLVDFGPIKPLDSAAHLAIENQKGLANEPLPLGISVADSSGGETVTVAGMPEGTDLSLGTALGSGSWMVPVTDLDKTFVGAPTNFVGAMTAKVTLNSPTGMRLDTGNIRFEWSKPEFYSAPPTEQTEPTGGSIPQTSERPEPTPAPGPIRSPPISDTAQSFAAPRRADPKPGPTAPAAAKCLASADEVRRLAPKAWPKWTYGPHGERCWYSGRKPVFTTGQ